MFADLLKRERQTASLSARKAGEAIGVDRKTIYAWEAGAYPPSAEALGRLIRLLRLPPQRELELWRARAGIQGEAPTEAGQP